VNVTGNVHCPNLKIVCLKHTERTYALEGDVRSVGKAPVLKLYTCTLQLSLNFRIHKA
jgi:hypothetical protein